MKLVVVCPHFSPDTAPTGELMTRVVAELAERGHELHVVTALPYYQHHQVEPGWRGRPWRTERTSWGSVTRVHPFPSDKTSIPRRAVSFGAFCALAGSAALPGGRADGVLAQSPPLPLGLVGAGVATARRAPLVFNVQDIFPDVAIELGKLTDPRVVAAALRLERTTYRRADAVTVLSDDLRRNVASKVAEGDRDKVRVIPNFVDTDVIRPVDRLTAYRRELGIGEEQTVVLYAGNVGLSQPLELVVEAARRLAARPDVVFVVNGGGSGMAELQRQAAGLPNLRLASYQPRWRLSEVLATGDVHLVLLRAGLGASSVPSKMYSTFAAGRPLVASIDADSEVARVVEATGSGVVAPPEDPDAFARALDQVLDDAEARRRMGERGRAWVEGWASPGAVATAYEALFEELSGRARRPDRRPTR